MHGRADVDSAMPLFEKTLKEPNNPIFSDSSDRTKRFQNRGRLTPYSQYRRKNRKPVYDTRSQFGKGTTSHRRMPPQDEVGSNGKRDLKTKRKGASELHPN